MITPGEIFGGVLGGFSRLMDGAKNPNKPGLILSSTVIAICNIPYADV
jgi:hypothetical protein